MIRKQKIKDTSDLSWMCFEYGVCYHKLHIQQ